MMNHTDTARDDQHAAAMALHERADFGSVCSRTERGVTISLTVLSKDWHTGGAERYSDADLAYEMTQARIFPGAARAAGYLMELDTIADRRDADSQGYYLMNRGVASRHADGVWLAVRDIKAGRTPWRHTADVIRAADPEFARLDDQRLYREAVADGIV